VRSGLLSSGIGLRLLSAAAAGTGTLRAVVEVSAVLSERLDGDERDL
jgi:hypothetical protein